MKNHLQRAGERLDCPRSLPVSELLARDFCRSKTPPLASDPLAGFSLPDRLERCELDSHRKRQGVSQMRRSESRVQAGVPNRTSVSVNVQSATWRVAISAIESLSDGVLTDSWTLPLRKGHAQSELIGSSAKQGNTRPLRSCFALTTRTNLSE